MKNVLITGAGSYIGTWVENYLAQWPESYRVQTLDMVDGAWREQSFAGFDCVFHVAGIAHIRETASNAHLYTKINRDLAIETAQKAKAEGVGQFIFLSSMNVYGVDRGPVDPMQAPDPKSHYGNSKLQAEQGIVPLADESFTVAVLRPPLVYGKGCKGNFQHLVKIARLTPLFPDYENVRSMLSVENLAEFVRQLVDSGEGGLFCPQDPEYVCTSRMVQRLGTDMGRKIRLMKALNPAVTLAMRCTETAQKAFDDLYYTK